MGAQPQPAQQGPDPRALQERLDRLGITVTPSTPAGRRNILNRDRPRIQGATLSETVERMRDEERAGA